MKKISILFFILLIIFSQIGYSQIPRKDDYSIAYISDIIGMDDSSYNELTWKGIVDFDRNEFSLEQLDYYVPKKIEDYLSLLEEVSVYENFDIIAIGSPFMKAELDEIAKTIPDIQYIYLGSIVDNRKNVTSAVFSTEQGSFLVGIVAAIQTQRDKLRKIGFIGDIDNPKRRAYEAGFVAGVRAYAPGIQVTISYANSNTDQGAARRLADEQYNSGISVIYNVAGDISEGVFQQAKLINRTYYDEDRQGISIPRRTFERPVWVIGSDVDRFNQGIYQVDPTRRTNDRSVTLTSMIFKYDVAIYDMLQKLYSGQFPSGQALYYSIKNNGVGIPEKNPNIKYEIKAVLDRYTKKIINGERTVPKEPDRITSPILEQAQNQRR